MINIVLLFTKGDINYGVYVLVVLIIILIFGIKFSNKGLMYETNREDCKYFSEIINGHHTHMSVRKKDKIHLLFLDWKATEKHMLNYTPYERWEELNQCKINKNLYVFKFIYLNDPPNKTLSPKIKFFLKDVFTDIFSSKENKDNIFLCNYVTKLFILKGISFDESSNYFIHIKEHFMNKKGEIIQFDIYHDTQK